MIYNNNINNNVWNIMRRYVLDLGNGNVHWRLLID